MQRKGFLFLDAAIALVLVLATLYITTSTLTTIISSVETQSRTIALLASAEKAMTTCAQFGDSNALAKCNENYYFYGIVDEGADEKIGGGNFCIARLGIKAEKIVQIVVCDA